MSKDKYFSTGEAAAMLGVSTRTLQYYDNEGLVSPSQRTEADHRQYGWRDITLLQQILSFKFLGFSLAQIKSIFSEMETPQDFVNMLEQQESILAQKISGLKKAQKIAKILKQEVNNMDALHFEKYSSIITLLREGRGAWWAISRFDDELWDYVNNKYTQDPEAGEVLMNQWEAVLDDMIEAQSKNITPESVEGQDLATRCWEVIFSFTGGDMSLLPKLIKFNQRIENDDHEQMQKVKKVEKFMGKTLEVHLGKQNMQ